MLTLKWNHLRQPEEAPWKAVQLLSRFLKWFRIMTMMIIWIFGICLVRISIWALKYTCWDGHRYPLAGSQGSPNKVKVLFLEQTNYRFMKIISQLTILFVYDKLLGLVCTNIDHWLLKLFTLRTIFISIPLV